MKQKVLLLYLESGFGHISSMDSIYQALIDNYSDRYDIQKSYIMREDGYDHLTWMEKFFCKQVENTNKIPGFGRFIFWIISLLGGQHIMRFYHRQLAVRSFRQGLEALRRRNPDVIVSNHYFTDLLAVEYKHRINPDCVVVNYNPDNTLHTFWDKRDGVFVVNNEKAFKRALRLGFKEESLRLVTPCVRQVVEKNTLTRAQLREKYGLPADKFTVVIADGGYMAGRGPKFAREIIKRKLPITLCVITGKNRKCYERFQAIAEGRDKRLKVDDNMTLKVYEFVPEAYELYGAADVFLTKGGPNAVLDSVYMRTPVIIDYCPHVIEETTAKFFIDEYHCGETAFTKGKAVKRIRALMADRSALDGYLANIEKFVAIGNGANAVADIVVEEAEKARSAMQDGEIDGIDVDGGEDTPCDESTDAEYKVEGVAADIVTDGLSYAADEEMFVSEAAAQSFQPAK
ncbi:MAG: hypothetical protein J1F39_02690 [Clostridiales bacterium]|nr:hypothetical protein [Clostridiales bacterium]